MATFFSSLGRSAGSITGSSVRFSRVSKSGAKAGSGEAAGAKGRTRVTRRPPSATGELEYPTSNAKESAEQFPTFADWVAVYYMAGAIG